MKLAIAQMVLGVVIAGNSVGYPIVIYQHPIALRGYFESVETLRSGLSYLPAAMPVAYLFPVALGLAVLGCGIAQYLKARK